MATFVSHGNVEHIDELDAIHADETTDLWTVNRNARPGDTIVFYVKAPVSSFVAVGTVHSEPFLDNGEYGWPGKHMAEVSVQHLVGPMLKRTVALEHLPNWGWLKTPQSPARVPSEFEDELLALLEATPNTNEEIESSTGGAGFGTDPEQNRLVEQAAVDAVWGWFEDEGWTVEDRQSAGCGYDLLCRRGREEKHVEVKGVAGDEVSFIITANEVNTAKRDPHFLLSVVTRALEPEALTMHDFSREEFLDAFELSPLTYKASLQ